MKKKIFSVFTAAAILCATISAVCVVSATGTDRIGADAFSVPADSYDSGNATITAVENGLEVNGSLVENGAVNARYAYSTKIPVTTDGLEIKFTVDSKPAGWLMFSLFKEGAVCGWGEMTNIGIIAALRFDAGDGSSDCLSSLSHSSGGYPIHSLQTKAFDYSTTKNYTLSIKPNGTNYEVKLNDTLVATHSAAEDAFAWLNTELANGAVLSFSMFNSAKDTTPFKMTIKSINGKPAGNAPAGSESSEEGGESSEVSTVSSEESSEASSAASSEASSEVSSEPAKPSNIDKFAAVGSIDTQKIEQTSKGLKLSGPTGNPQNFSYVYKDKLDVAKDGFKMKISFDQYAPANQFFAIALGDVATGWGGWNNSNPDKGLVLVVRPTDSWIEIHTMTGNEWPTHNGDMNKNLEIIKGKSLTLEIKKVSGAYKCYINGNEMTQFRDKILKLSETLDNGAYLTLATLNWNENKNMPAAATVYSINGTSFAEGGGNANTPQTGENTVALLMFSLFGILSCAGVITMIRLKKKNEI